MKSPSPFNSLAFILLSYFSAVSAAEQELPKQIAASIDIRQHGYADLEQFEMGELEFNGLDFKQSVQKLTDKYRAICNETREQALDVSIEITSTPDTKPTYTTKGSFNLIRKRLCAIYGMDMKISDSIFHLPFYSLS